MVVLVAYTTPISFQLRWGLTCRKPAPAFLWIRFPLSNTRLLLTHMVVAALSLGEEGDGQASRASSGGFSDPFSGWSGKESDGGSQQKGRFGGIKRQMEPMMLEQEVLLVPDEQNENIDSHKNGSSLTLSEEGPSYGLDSRTCIGEEKTLSVETIDIASDSIVDCIVHVESSMIEDNGLAGTDVDPVNSQSRRFEHLQHS